MKGAVCCAVSFASTVSTIAFAFYIQPIAMPMLREMPPGKAGYRILAWSMRLVICGALPPSAAAASGPVPESLLNHAYKSRREWGTVP